MQWFKEELLGGNHRALGVYLALFACRLHTLPTSYDFPKVMNKLEREIFRRLRGRSFAESAASLKLLVKTLNLISREIS